MALVNNEIIIRKFHSADRSAVRAIAWATALVGEPADVFFADREILADALTLYFTDYEPESIFIAEKSGNVVGYLTGTKNAKQMEKVFQKKLLWTLLKKALCRGVFLKKRNWRLFLGGILSFLKGEFFVPAFNQDYPALLHINLLPQVRGGGTGSLLLAGFEDELKKSGVTGVHLATMSEAGRNFFKKNGFRILHVGKRSYFRHISGKDLPLYIFGKKL